MFTGIIEEIGTVRRIERGAKGAWLTIGAKTVLEGTKIGDSIATNGVCLTVTSMTADSFTADVMAETLRRSGLGALQSGSPVNLERAMPADGRFGGHIVSGHIDGTGTVAALRREDNAVWVTVHAAPSLLRYIVEKGSIAIDGVSLTVAAVDTDGFSVSIIPHTGAQTILLGKKPGDTVNLECDVIGKYVEKLLGPHQEKPGSGIRWIFWYKRILRRRQRTMNNLVEQRAKRPAGGQDGARHRRPRPRKRGRPDLRGGIRHHGKRQLHGDPRQGPDLHAHVGRAGRRPRPAADGGGQHGQPRDRFHGLHRLQGHDHRHFRGGARPDRPHVRGRGCKAVRLPPPGAHVPAARGRGRRAQAHRPHGGDSRPVPSGRTERMWSVLRDHARGRHHDAHDRAQTVRAAA